MMYTLEAIVYFSKLNQALQEGKTISRKEVELAMKLLEL